MSKTTQGEVQSVKWIRRVNVQHVSWLAFLVVVIVAVAGCGRASSPAGEASFNSASPAIKAVWHQAVQADQTNDYVKAVALYRQLMAKPQLTAGQQQAVRQAASKLSIRIWKAVHNGDPKAKQALLEEQKLNTSPPPRQ